MYGSKYGLLRNSIHSIRDKFLYGYQLFISLPTELILSAFCALLKSSFLTMEYKCTLTSVKLVKIYVGVILKPFANHNIFQ